MVHRWSLGILVAMLAMLGGAALAGEARAPRDIITLLPKDGIPAILDPKPLLVPGRMAKAIADDARVLGVALGSVCAAAAGPRRIPSPPCRRRRS